MAKAAETAGAAECPECGQECQDRRGLRGHLRFGHGMSTEEIAEAVRPVGQQQERAQEQQAEPVEVEVETLPVPHESSDSGAPAPAKELPHDLRELQQLLQEVRTYKHEAREMMEERGLFDDDEADRKLVRLWEKREERITRKIVEIGSEEGVDDEPGFLETLFGAGEDEEDERELL